MSLEAVVSGLLNASSSLVALVGGRISMAVAPEDTAYPVLIWHPITGTPIEPINAFSGGQIMLSRVQVTAIADSPDVVRQIQVAVRAALEYQHGTFSGVQVNEVVRVLVGPWDYDPQTKLYMQPVDYRFNFYDI